MAKGKKTGGRQKGTPNKQQNPLKSYLREHSLSYFERRIQKDLDGIMREVSDFELDIESLKAEDRVAAEIKMLEYHTPKQKAVDVTIDSINANITIEDRLRELCKDDD